MPKKRPTDADLLAAIRVLTLIETDPDSEPHQDHVAAARLLGHLLVDELAERQERAGPVDLD